MTWPIVGQIAGQEPNGFEFGVRHQRQKKNFRDGLKIGTQLSSNGF